MEAGALSFGSGASSTFCFVGSATSLTPCVTVTLCVQPERPRVDGAALFGDARPQTAPVRPAAQAEAVPIAYTFTLAAPHKTVARRDGLRFNEGEFRRFWEWLQLVRRLLPSSRHAPPPP